MIPGLLSDDLVNALFRELTCYRATILQRPMSQREDWWGEHLALRRVVGQNTPALLGTAAHGSKVVVWFELEQKKSEWMIQETPMPEWIASTLCDDNTVGGSGPNLANLTCTYRVYDRVKESDILRGFSQDIHELLAGAATSLVQQWRRKELGQWAKLGWREWAIPSYPSKAPPCSEIRGAGRWRDGRGTPVTVEDLFNDIQHLRLLQAVPESIWAIFNRAVKLYVYGYLDWEFFTMSQHQAVMALETSLKRLFLDHLTLPVTLDLVTGTGDIIQSRVIEREPLTYQMLWDTARELFKTQQRSPDGEKLKVIVGGAPFPLSKGTLRDWAHSRGLISDSECVRLKYYFRLRDNWSHPEFTGRDWITWAYERLKGCALLINRMWARECHPKNLLWEHAFRKKPPWATSQNTVQ